MTLSQTDEFFDDWGDMSPGFTDRVLQNVALVERQTKHANNSMTPKPIHANEKASNSFEVFRDPPEHRVASPQHQNLTPLREIDLNQHDVLANTGNQTDKKETLSKDTKQADTTKRTSYTKGSASIAKPASKVESDDDEHMWMDFDVDFQSMISDLEKDGALDGQQLSSKATDNTPVIHDPVHKQHVDNDPVDKQLVETTLSKYGGFMTAGTKKSLKSNSKARDKALSLFNTPKDNNENMPITEEPSTAPKKEPPVSNPKTDREHEEPPSSKMMGGFTTGSGRAVARISEASLRKAQNLLFAPDIHKESSTTTDEFLPQCGQKRPAEESDETMQFKYEDVLSHYGSFKTGNSKSSITVSPEAKRRAVSLFNSSETTRELTQSSQKLSSPNSSSSASSQQSLLQALSTENDNEEHPSPPDQQVPKRVRKPANVKTKPYRSPIIQDKYELTKAAVSGQSLPGTVRGKGPSVFSMKATVPRYSLSQLGKPLQHRLEELKQMNISDEILRLTIANAADVRFSGWGPKDAREALLKAGALEKFISLRWVENHYRWIIWKVACMIRSYPAKYQDWWCQAKVVDQLLYRYEREINLGHRSVLKRIHEHDDTPAKHMVLVVAAITELDSTQQNDKGKYQLLLTDGWYGILAVVDPRMERAITNGKLSIGTKLSICGSQLIGDMQPHSPLEASSSDTSLSITTNGSRIAAWDTKLGYQPQRLVYRSLSSVHGDGGAVSALDVIVCRKYPMMYNELLANGTRIKRTAREEEEVRRSSGMYQDGMGDGWRPPFLEHGGVQISQYNKSVQSSSPIERKVSAYFKVRICDYHHGNKMATLLLLDANELNHMDISEGSRYRIFFTMPYTLGDNTINLKTTRRTRWETMRTTDPAKLLATPYIPRQITTTASLSTLASGSEIDIAALVLHSAYTEEKRPSEGRSFWHQTLIVTDISKGLCQVKLRLACRPMRNIDEQVIGFANLRHQVHDAKYSITHLQAGDDCEIYLKQKVAPYMFQATQSVHQWIQNNSREVQEMKQRVKDLLQS